MSRSNKSHHNRHHPAHAKMKKSYNRRLRHLTREALSQGIEPMVKMAGFVNLPFYCCGNHDNDWRY